MTSFASRVRLSLLAFVVVASTGAASPGCRDKSARNGTAQNMSNTQNNSNAQNNSNTANNSNGERAVLGREFKLGYGRETVVEGSGLRVKFAEVVADSRCPVGVTCVWEGDAEVRLDVAGAGGAEASQVTLHTSDRFGRESKHAGYVFKLVSLTPQPKADSKLNPSDYVLTLSVSKE